MIADILGEIAKASGSKAKLGVLHENAGNAAWERFLRLVHDPRISYWVSESRINWSGWERAFDIITRLSGDEPPRSPERALDDMMNWLEFSIGTRRITGNQAVEAVQQCVSDMDEAHKDAARALLRRGMRNGMSTTSVLKVHPNLFRVEPYMRCLLANEKTLAKIDYPAIIQRKADGMFSNTHVAKHHGAYDRIYQTSRQGTPLGNQAIFQEGLEMLFSKNGMEFADVVHGEIVCYQNGKPMERQVSNGIVNSTMINYEPWPEHVTPRLEIWDIVPVKEYDVGRYEESYGNRFGKLLKMFDGFKHPNIGLIEWDWANTVEEAMAFYINMVAQGYEGAVLKDIRGHWFDGDSEWQLKIKPVRVFEMRFKGLNPGEGKFADTFGSMQVESEDGIVKCGVSGMKDVIRNEIYEHMDELVDSIVSVKCNGLIKKGDEWSLVNPRYDEKGGIRPPHDKLSADTFDYMKKAFDNPNATI